MQCFHFCVPVVIEIPPADQEKHDEEILVAPVPIPLTPAQLQARSMQIIPGLGNALFAIILF